MYKLENLNYLYQDLEPFIDTHTMGLHYNKHAKKYLKNLNELLLKNNFNFSISLNELAQKSNYYNWTNKEDILFNLGGVINHDLYFQSLNKFKVEPQGLLKTDLLNKYSSLEEFNKQFIDTAKKLKGSGYTFLEYNQYGLEIKNYQNQDNPLFHGNIPLFTVDLWEHAYYLNYKNDKDRYLENFFEIANFSLASNIYEKIMMNKKKIYFL